MQLRRVTHCPACGGTLSVRRLECDDCRTAVEGRFSPSRLDRLTPEQQKFVEVFLLARGNIKEVERMLGISYPTVRSRLDEVLASMGHRVVKEPSAEERSQILADLDQGKITVNEAISRLRGESHDG